MSGPVPFDRAEALERLAATEFDVLVVGGGVTGAGVALDAASRGLRTALVERDDFASGTSSKSSKLVHGGLRYLQQGDVRLVYQALRERQILRRNAPHLVKILPFLIPIFSKDGLINRKLARAMGSPMRYDSPARIMEEIARCTPIMGGVRYERLEGDGLIWPCPDEHHPGTPILHRESFTRGKGRFSVLGNVATLETPDEDYPLILVTGRRLAHYNNGSMTRRCEGLAALEPEEYVEIHPDDAEPLAIGDGCRVQVSSRRGAIELTARVSERSRPGAVFMAFHHADPLVNILTSPGVDEIAGTPEYKACAVRLRPIRITPGNIQ